LAKALPPDYPIELTVYPNARHSFDRADLPTYRSRRARGGTTGYDPEAASLAWEKTREFLAKYFKAD
jgi:dienelactone hydrolase